MALVGYSDSESDGESAPAAPIPAPALKAQTTKAGFQKAAPGKIQVSLPSFKPEAGAEGEKDGADGPPAKRARTGGAFSGFNALLPAPKRTAAQNAPKKGVSLKTSSEAAFSREPVAEPAYNQEAVSGSLPTSQDVTKEPPAEPKLVGKATRFLPLSVSAKKRKKPISKAPAPVEAVKQNRESETKAAPSASEPEPPKPKPKKSLFSMSQELEPDVVDSTAGQYESIMIEPTSSLAPDPTETFDQISAPVNPNSLEAIAADMNLTAAQRRQLFGRNGKDANVTHFNLDAEYRNNEKLRESGEVIQHKAVKAVASGKHSLQQLVNNARTQEDALEDKWADGRRNRGEAGSKYGFGKG